MICNLILLTTPLGVSETFSKLEQTHAKMSKVAVGVTDGVSKYQPVYIAIDGMNGRISMPNLRLVEVSPSKTRFYDQILDQVASTPTRAVKNPVLDLISVAIVHRAPLGFLLDPSIRSEFLGDLKKTANWKLKGNQLIATASNKSSSVVAFDSFNRITQIKVEYSGKTLQNWKFDYTTPDKVASIPSTAAVVEGLSDRPTLPQTTDAKSVFHAQRVWRAMSGLRRGKVNMQVDTRKFTMSLEPGLVRESSALGSWVISGRKLTATSKGKNVLEKVGSPTSLYNALASAKFETSPLARYILNKKVPFLDVFDRASLVKLQGQVKINGVPFSIIAIKKYGRDIRLYTDSKYRIHLMSSTAKDFGGKTIEGARLTLNYQ